MLYKCKLTIPPNTLQNAPVRASVYLTYGQVTKVMVDFPPGCAGLAHVVILHKESQVWPSSPNEDFSRDTFPVEWAEDYPITEDPYELILVGWNQDAVYEHTVSVMFAHSRTVGNLTQYLLRLFGRS